MPELFITPQERRDLKILLEEHRIPADHKIIGVNPLAAYGAAKCWPAERFRELAVRFSKEKKVTLLFFGEPSTALQVQEMIRGIAPNVVNLAGRTSLREFMAWVEAVDLFLTNDSGPMHIAAALKTPLLALFGSTNEIATGPYKHGSLIHKHVECSPCYLRKCPIDFRCMKRIAVDEVFDEMQKILATSPYSVRRAALFS
jgi:heptosyltransferase-2